MQNPIIVAFIDDNADNVKYIVEKWKFDASIKLVGYHSGEEFISQYDYAEVPDCVFVEMRMPVMSGYDVLCWLKKHHPKTRTIGMSFSADNENMLTAAYYEAKGFMLKESPLPLERFHTFLTEIMAGKQLFRNEETTKKIVATLASGYVPSYSKLTTADKQLLANLEPNLTVDELASKLGIKKHTYNTKLQQIRKKLRLANMTALYHYAVKFGFKDLYK